MKRKKSTTNQWEDHYTRRARKEKFPARSVYKLKELQQKFRILKTGQRILDLGCSPGSWLLYAAEVVGPRGHVIGIDLKAVSVQLPANVRVYKGDILAPDDALKAALGGGFHVVLSDMAPATTGSKITDAARSFELCRAALALAEAALVPGGAFVCKIFQGDEFSEFINLVQQRFKAHKIYKPQSSRKASKEIYIVATAKK